MSDLPTRPASMSPPTKLTKRLALRLAICVATVGAITLSRAFDDVAARVNARGGPLRRVSAPACAPRPSVTSIRINAAGGPNMTATEFAPDQAARRFEDFGVERCPARAVCSDQVPRRALVLYALPAREHPRAQIGALNNFFYFQQFGVYPENASTELFDRVDYVFHQRHASIASTIACGDSIENLIALWVPKSECALCAHGRALLHVLRSPNDEDVALAGERLRSSYEYVVLIDALARGPFLRSDGPAWIDVLARSQADVTTTEASWSAADGRLRFRTDVLGLASDAGARALAALLESCSCTRASCCSRADQLMYAALGRGGDRPSVYSLHSDTLYQSEAAGPSQWKPPPPVGNYCPPHLDGCRSVFATSGLECERPVTNQMWDVQFLSTWAAPRVAAGAEALQHLLRQPRCGLLAMRPHGDRAWLNSTPPTTDDGGPVVVGRQPTNDGCQALKQDTARFARQPRDRATRAENTVECIQDHAPGRTLLWSPPVDFHARAACSVRSRIRCSRSASLGRALVVYALPALNVAVTRSGMPEREKRAISEDSPEVINWLYFKEFGIHAPGASTELFAGVDYVFYRMNLQAPGVELVARRENIRLMWVPASNCDLCSHSRIVNWLGGADNVTRVYSYFMFLNAGVRGPFQHERDPHWIDLFAMSGRARVTKHELQRASPGMTAVFLSNELAFHPQTFAFGVSAAGLSDLISRYSSACSSGVGYFPKWHCIFNAELGAGKYLLQRRFFIHAIGHNITVTAESAAPSHESCRRLRTGNTENMCRHMYDLCYAMFAKFGGDCLEAHAHQLIAEIHQLMMKQPQIRRSRGGDVIDSMMEDSSTNASDFFAWFAR